MSPLPLAERYVRFRDAVFSGCEEAPRLPGFEEPLSELDLQSLWYAGAFGSEFTTTDGSPVKIKDFGIWNSSAGPDFTGCAVELDGEVVRGDIELDPDVRDWERHRHGANPDYEGVVLHVVWHVPEGARFFTRNVRHREVPQVQITSAMLNREARPNRGLAAARIGRCYMPLRDMEDERLQSMLESAAQYRLELKSGRLHRAVAAHGREQAVYQALAQTLGYRGNQQGFMIVAQRLTVSKLLKRGEDEMEALLFGVSGFLEKVRYEDATVSTRDYLRSLWSEWWKVRESCERWLGPHQLPKWKIAGARPGNHPQRRLGALAAILKNWPRVSGPLMEATRWSRDGWKDVLSGLKHQYWNGHYTLLAEPAAKPLALVGETRINEMLANVVYPLLMPERTRLWAEYLEMPALLDNQKVKRALLRLFGDSPRGLQFSKMLHHHQGLLQIYEDFCLEDDSSCADCPFPERLKDWS